ncbi:MAG: hypothetical protein KFF77_01170 [Bacteroidetes bacterium]|nr:hypothetical protein [Bacteroidota bacterium]
MRYRILISALCAAALLFLCHDTLQSQTGLAHGGPDGMYVDLGNWVLPATVDGRQADAYRIERRVKGSREWTPVADVRGPSSAAELSGTLAGLATRFPELHDVTIDAALLYQRLSEGRDLKTIGMASRLLPVQLALGVRYLDTGAPRAELLEYRISHVLADGTVREAFVTPAANWPGAGDVATLQGHRTTGEPTAISVRYRVGGGLPPSDFRVFRREGLQGAFTELSTEVLDSCCTVSKALTLENDTMICLVYDKTVRKGTVYQYYMIPQDYFRNEGPVSDTSTVLSFRMSHVPLPERMKVHSIDTAGLLLTWRLREPSAVAGILIERGPKIDSGFVELFTAGVNDTSFLDMTITPMKRYYYRLRLVGPDGNRSSPSAVLIGIWKTSEEPVPPNGVQARAVDGGVRLSWESDTVQQLDGYYVYRSGGEGMEMQQISIRIPPTQTSYIDTLGLLGSRSYYYAMKSENTSHVQSPLSDTVSAVPGIIVTLAAPRGLNARVAGTQVHLYWDQQHNRSEGLMGYQVYRRSAEDRAWRPLADTLLESWENAMTDTDVQPGARYEYIVRAFGAVGDSSAPSLVAHAEIPIPDVYPPANLTAQPQGRIVSLRWDEIAQPSAKEFRLYRYTRGRTPQLVKSFSLDIIGYVDEIKERESPVFYYLTTVGQAGQESPPGREVAVILR